MSAVAVSVAAGAGVLVVVCTGAGALVGRRAGSGALTAPSTTSANGLAQYRELDFTEPAVAANPVDQ